MIPCSTLWSSKPQSTRVHREGRSEAKVGRNIWVGQSVGLPVCHIHTHAKNPSAQCLATDRRTVGLDIVLKTPLTDLPTACPFFWSCGHRQAHITQMFLFTNSLQGSVHHWKFVCTRHYFSKGVLFHTCDLRSVANVMYLFLCLEFFFFVSASRILLLCPSVYQEDFDFLLIWYL